jgi:hypothetical protein
MPTTSASSASSGQRSADLLEHRRENSQATNRIRERTVRANGLVFPILEAGSGRLVLCLHGFPDHAQSWAHFLDRLAQEGYWDVAPALRGYWAGDVLALITWGCRRVAAAGKRPRNTWKNWATQITDGHFMYKEAHTPPERDREVPTTSCRPDFNPPPSVTTAQDRRSGDSRRRPSADPLRPECIAIHERYPPRRRARVHKHTAGRCQRPSRRAPTP